MSPKVCIVFLLVAVAYSEAAPKPIISSVLRGVSKTVTAVGEAATGIVGEVGNVVAGVGDALVGRRASSSYEDGTAASLVQASQALKTAAQASASAGPNIIINQHQNSEAY